MAMVKDNVLAGLSQGFKSQEECNWEHWKFFAKMSFFNLEFACILLHLFKLVHIVACAHSNIHMVARIEVLNYRL